MNNAYKSVRGEFLISLAQKIKMKAPFSVAIGNGELLQQCFPKQSRTGTARLK